MESAQVNYEAAIDKQARTAAAMAEVQKKLKTLQETGQTSDEIKAVLKDFASVLVDLCSQFEKLEIFYTMLSGFIDSIVRVRADTLAKATRQDGRRALANGNLQISEVIQQTLYTALFQLKAYFSLLADFSYMYVQIDRRFLMHGVELSSQLAGQPIPGLAEQLCDFSQDSVRDVAETIERVSGDFASTDATQ